jgi:hypothetical protein
MTLCEVIERYKPFELEAAFLAVFGFWIFLVAFENASWRGNEEIRFLDAFTILRKTLQVRLF